MKDNKLNRIMNNGSPVVECNVGDNKMARIYALYESRGCQTGYKPSLFFFLICFDGIIPKIWRAISDKSGAQRAEYLNFWNSRGGYLIHNQELFNKYFNF